MRQVLNCVKVLGDRVYLDGLVLNHYPLSLFLDSGGGRGEERFQLLSKAT